MGEQPVPLLLTRLPWPQVQPPGEAEGELWHPRIPLPRGGQLRAGLLLHGHVEHGRHHLHAVRQGWGGGGASSTMPGQSCPGHGVVPKLYMCPRHPAVWWAGGGCWMGRWAGGAAGHRAGLGRVCACICRQGKAQPSCRQEHNMVPVAAHHLPSRGHPASLPGTALARLAPFWGVWEVPQPEGTGLLTPLCPQAQRPLPLLG